MPDEKLALPEGEESLPKGQKNPEKAGETRAGEAILPEEHVETEGAPQKEPPDEEAPPPLPGEKRERAAQRAQQEQIGSLMQALGAALLREQLWQIRLLDPTVQSWSDVRALPQAGQFDELVAGGCTPVQAFRAVYFERLTEKQRDAAHRAARSGAAKAHLSPIPQAAGDEVHVPAEVLRTYRAFFPRWSEAKIRADYRRHR